MTSRTGTFDWTLEHTARLTQPNRDGDVAEWSEEVLVAYSFTPGSPATRMDPGDGPEAEILSIAREDGTLVDFDALPEHVQDDLREAACFAAEDGEDAARAKAEDAYESRRRGE